MKDALKRIFKVSIGLLLIGWTYQFIVSENHSFSNAINLLVNLVSNPAKLVALLIFVGIGYLLFAFLFEDGIFTGIAGIIFIVGASILLSGLASMVVEQYAWGQVIIRILGIPTLVTAHVAAIVGIPVEPFLFIIFGLYYFVFCRHL
ncbi:MAG: hypothetical protein ACI4LX_02340 [Treponema sp.]